MPIQRMVPLLLVAASAWMLPGQVGAQGPVIELSSEACPDCSITLTPLVTLGDAEGPGLIGGISAIARLADGRYVLSAEGENDLIKVFASDGTFLQSVGGRGQGPGEFGYIRFLKPSGNDLHVIDLSPRRQTVFSAGFDVLRTNPYQLSPGWDALVVSDSLTVVNAYVYRGDRAGYLLHAINRRGDTTRSFAMIPGGVARGASGRSYFRNLCVSSSGGIWALYRTRYRFEEWSLDGELLRTFIRSAPWFPDHPVDGGSLEDDQGRKLPPQLWPAASDIRADREERLWVTAQIPDERWPGAVTTVSTVEGESIRINDRVQARDTIVDVLDLQSGALLVSARFDQALWAFVGEDEIVSTSLEADGSTRAHIWRLALHEPPPR
jgi:hypothetical protein